LKDRFKDALAENTTFTVQNFEVEKNNISLKCSSHPFKLVFNSCTLIQDLNVHKIPMPEYKFTDFADIKQGKARPDVVVGKRFIIYILPKFDKFELLQPLT
jgi:hypothetical protein